MANLINSNSANTTSPAACNPDAPKCKPRLHGNLPSHSQEMPFAEYLLALNLPANNGIDVWFTQLLGTPDVDAVIVCRNLGLFVIELKSWGLSLIKKITAVEGVEIDKDVKKSTKKSPWQQSFEAGDALSGKLSSAPGVKRCALQAWISCGASLFNISRTQFLRKFQGNASTPHAVEAIARGVLFAEDLADGATLIERLKYIKANPLYRRKPNKTIDSLTFYSAELVEELDEFINFKLLPTASPTKTDLTRLQRIEQEEERGLEKLDLSTHVLCTGYAGTGKTVLGIQAALRCKKATLFTCFNKVLATDIRRLMTFSRKCQEFPFEVYDVFDLMETCESRLELPFLSKTKDEKFDPWASRRVKRIIEQDKASQKRLAQLWDLIIVDEAQDLQDYAWDLLDWLCGFGGAMFVIDGKRQTLYRDDRAEFLDNTLQDVVSKENRKDKRRVFRTPNETFLLGQLFVETYPFRVKAERLWRDRYREQYLKAKIKNASQSAFEFELSREGSAPKMHNLATDVGHWEPESAVEKTAFLVRDAMKRLEPLGITPSDLLLLVPFKEMQGNHIDWKSIAVAACSKLDLDYLDYTNESFRRVAYSPSDVRIATFHSSRGIEGCHSIVLGFECLSAAAKKTAQFAANLGYISLTRSLFETDVLFYRPPGSLNVDVAFLESLMEITGF